MFLIAGRPGCGRLGSGALQGIPAVTGPGRGTPPEPSPPPVLSLPADDVPAVELSPVITDSKKSCGKLLHKLPKNHDKKWLKNRTNGNYTQSMASNHETKDH